MSETEQFREWSDADIAQAFAQVALPDGTVGAEEIMFVVQGMRDEMRYRIALLESESEPGQQVAALDFPDSAGWWVYRGKDEGVIRLESFKVAGDNVIVQWWGDCFPMTYTVAHFKQFLGDPKFYRLTMPWESQPSEQAQLPDDVREALALYLDNYYYRAKDWGGGSARTRAGI